MPANRSKSAINHDPLVLRLWPHRSPGFAGILRAIILIALGTALLALSAKVNLPLPYVPMTLQTLVVLLIGTAYGWPLGVATVVVYLCEGAMGLPVFAGPIGGLSPFMGPTAGYLIGFVAAAFVMDSLRERGWDRSFSLLFAAMVIAHAVILAAGFAWLAFGMRFGAEKAWLLGIQPFIAATIVKSALGAALISMVWKIMDRAPQKLNV